MLNNATGVLSKAKQLDREKTDFYSLLVSATDQGSPALWSITTVNITVRDVNDKFPEIHAQDIFYVQEVYLSGQSLLLFFLFLLYIYFFLMMMKFTLCCLSPPRCVNACPH